MFGKFRKSAKAAAPSRTIADDLPPEAALDVLGEVFHRFLGRMPDDAARGWMADRIQKGQSGLSLIDDIMKSPDFIPAMASLGTDRDFAILSDVHLRFLGRRPDAAAEQWLRGRLQAGQSGLSLVAELMTTPEYAEWTRNPLFVPPGHFYSPITTAAEVEVALATAKAQETRHDLPGIAIDRPAMLALWDKIGKLPRDAARDHRRYHPDNPHFGGPDAFIWEGMLRTILPPRVIEVGSGWSSALLLDTIDVHFPHKVDLTFIEPYPALLRGRLGDEAKDVRIIESGVQAADLRLFDALETGDILFIDSTHILKTGSDVVHELFEILPRLKSGVYVHFHDVFWPFEYLRGWALDENRSWNELYALRAYLTDNPNWEIVMFNDYLAKTAVDEVRRHYPAFTGILGGSLYLRKR